MPKPISTSQSLPSDGPGTSSSSGRGAGRPARGRSPARVETWTGWITGGPRAPGPPAPSTSLLTSCERSLGITRTASPVRTTTRSSTPSDGDRPGVGEEQVAVGVHRQPCRRGRCCRPRPGAAPRPAPPRSRGRSSRSRAAGSRCRRASPSPRSRSSPRAAGRRARHRGQLRVSGDLLQPAGELRLEALQDREQRRAAEDEDAGVPEVVAGAHEPGRVLGRGLLHEAAAPGARRPARARAPAPDSRSRSRPSAASPPGSSPGLPAPPPGPPAPGPPGTRPDRPSGGRPAARPPRRAGPPPAWSGPTSRWPGPCCAPRARAGPAPAAPPAARCAPRSASASRGADPDVPRLDERAQPLQGLAQQAPLPFQGQELLGAALARQRPEPRAAAAGQDQRPQAPPSSKNPFFRMARGVYRGKCQITVK